MLHDESVRSAIVRRIDQLTPTAPARWGRMRVDQMLHHMSSALEMALGRVVPVPRHTLFKRTAFKFLAFNMPWPKGKAPTAPELVAAGEYEFQTERARLKQLIEEVAAQKLDRPWPAHPAFGPLTGREWSRLQHKHFNHHLQQFGV